MRMLHILFVFICVQSALSIEHVLTPPKPVIVSLDIREKDTKSPILGAKI
ncbi:MAG: hypothetical protein RLZZ578_1416, partial [Bacteroidota bacterium]